jgi:capsular polysaccharide biosynthesis protein
MDKPETFEIDLSKYIEILIRQWMLIVGTALIGTLAVAAFLLIAPTTYQARVLVVTTKIASSVTFGSAIETLSEGQLPVTLVDQKARLQSYVALVSNPVIAERVYEDLRADFGDKLPDPETLQEMVRGTVLKGSDSVEIIVTNRDPALVSAIANAWGREYVDSVNNLYAVGSYQEKLLTIQRQTDEAHANFLDVEQDYIAFLSSSPLEEYKRIQEQLIPLNRLLLDARGLLEQVEAGGEGAAASNALAVTLFKTQVLASNPYMNRSQTSPGTSQANPFTIQFQANPVAISSQDLVADLKSMVGTLERRCQDLIERVDFLVEHQKNGSLSASLESRQLNPGNRAISLSSEVENTIRLLTSQIESEEGRKRDLTSTRDLAWSSYHNLATKEAELIIASQTGGQEVVLGSKAYVSENGSSIVKNVVLAALIGLAIGVFLAFFIEFIWGYKGREPQPLIAWNFGSREENKI